MGRLWSEDIRAKLDTLAAMGCEIRYGTDPRVDVERPYVVEIWYQGKRIASCCDRRIDTAATFAYEDAEAELRVRGVIRSA